METRSIKILVVSSPTGGHLYPAIEVSRQLLNSGYKIIFVTQKKTEFVKIVKTELQIIDCRLQVETISAEKFSRTNPIKAVTFLVSMINSIMAAIKILTIHRPNLVFSTGGYASVPVILTFKLLFPLKPIILQEQNYVLGIANKFLSILATKVCCGFPTSKLIDNKKYFFTGNPIREKFKKKIEKSTIYKKFGFEKDKLTILIFGGSQGAKSINEAMVNLLKLESEKFNNVQILHITGKIYFEQLKKDYKNINVKSVIMPYFSDIEEGYNIADLIISRAGAMTVSELIYFQKPAVLVPFPYAAEFHQNQNAQYLKKHNCVEVVYQKYGWEKIFNKKVLEFVKNKDLLIKYQTNYKTVPISEIDIQDVISKVILNRILD